MKNKLLKNNILIVIIFYLIVTFVTIFHMSFYRLYLDNINNIEKIYQILDENILTILNIDLSNLASPLTYYAQFLIILTIFLSLFSIILGIKTISTNYELDNYLKTLPITKKKHYLNKVFNSLLFIFILNFTLFITTIIIFCFFKADSKIIIIFNIFLALFLSQVCFYAISLMLQTFIKSTSKVIFISILIATIFLVIDLLYRTTQLEILSYINPLSFFNVNYIIKNHHLELDTLVAFVSITIFAFTFSYSEYLLGDNHD